MKTTKEQRKKQAIKLMEQLKICKPYINGFIKYDDVCFFEFYAGYWAFQNPELLEKMVVEIGKAKKSNFKLKKVTYSNERKGYEIVLDLLEKSKLEKEKNK